MLKRFFSFYLLTATLIAGAYDLPGFREVNGLQIHLLPDKPDANVVFTFEKQDLNGYSGSDAVVFSLISPSGKLVWEETCPDDGTIIGNWKTGPRQPVKCTFKAAEKGIYCIKVNTPSSVDMMLLFDRSKAENTSWALSGNRFRTSDIGQKKIQAFFLLPPKKLGEKREQILQLTTTPHSRVRKMTLLSGNQVLIPVTDMKPQPKTGALLRYHKFPVNRPMNENVCELRAEAFADLAPFQFPQYGDFRIFAERKSAEKFEKELRHIETENSLTLKTPAKYADMAFARGVTYQLEFVPAGKAAFDFELLFFGKKYRFTQKSPKVSAAVPAGSLYSAMDLSAAPEGRFLVTRMTKQPVPIAPEGGITAKGSEELFWTAQPETAKYAVQFRNPDSGKTLTVETADNHLALASVTGKLSPGVWQWKAGAVGKGFGAVSFFILPVKADTTLLYFHDFTPVRDSVAGEKVSVISVKCDGKKSSELDLSRSKLLLNGKAFPLEALSSDTIGLKQIPSLRPGFNTVALTVLDKAGNMSRTEWGFFGMKPEPRKLAGDESGRIFFNGVPFFPVIYYGYQFRQPIERNGFNTVLFNTLADGATLNGLLKRNLKALDSGSVYHGYYSKGSTPEADVQKYAKSPAVRHHARLGAWMDEMDVHRPLSKIKEFLGLYGPAENGWRGVCSCNSALYAPMTDCGDYLMVDFYTSGKGLFAHDQRTVLAKKAAGKKPLMMLVSGFSSSDPALTGFIPTPREAEYTAFSALRNKVNALGLYQCGKYRMECYPETWKTATAIYKKISALSFILYGKDVPEAVESKAENGKIGVRAIRFENRLYILAQNSSFEPATAVFRIKIPVREPVKVLFEDRLVTVRNDQFTDGFQSAGTHLYCMELKEK